MLAKNYEQQRREIRRELLKAKIFLFPYQNRSLNEYIHEPPNPNAPHKNPIYTHNLKLNILTIIQYLVLTLHLKLEHLN